MERRGREISKFRSISELCVDANETTTDWHRLCSSGSALARYVYFLGGAHRKRSRALTSLVAYTFVLVRGVWAQCFGTLPGGRSGNPDFLLTLWTCSHNMDVFQPDACIVCLTVEMHDKTSSHHHIFQFLPRSTLVRSSLNTELRQTRTLLKAIKETQERPQSGQDRRVLCTKSHRRLATPEPTVKSPLQHRMRRQRRTLLRRSVLRRCSAAGDFFPWWFFGMAAGVEEPPEAAWSGRQSSRDLDVRAPYRAARPRSSLTVSPVATGCTTAVGRAKWLSM